MPYSNPEEAKQAARERMRRIRENKRENENQGEQPKTVGRTGVKPEGEQPPNVTPVNPTDWSDRRNYTLAYLKCMDSQGYELTEASKVAMKGHKVEDPEWCRKHSQRGVAVQGSPVGMKEVGKYLVPQGLTVELCQRLLKLSPSDAPLVTMLMRGDNLERLQKVVGILGKEAEHVWLGEHTLKEIGEIIGVAKPQELPQTAPVMQTPGVWQLPVYDHSKHKTGEWVRMWEDGQWVARQVPEIDAEGNPY